MRDEAVIDASTAAAILFNEPASPQARLAIEGRFLSAPDFLLIELASVGSKKIRRGEPVSMTGSELVASASELVDRLEVSPALTAQAFEMASTTRVSLYDGLYLSLAHQRKTTVLTFDGRLGRAANEVGLGDLVEVLAG